MRQSSAHHIRGGEETLLTPKRLPGWDRTALAAPMLECFAELGGAVPVCLSVCPAVWLCLEHQGPAGPSSVSPWSRCKL